MRLEHLNYAQSKNAYANFNSIKVRLEPDMRAAGLNALLFQFHKGAIRTTYQNRLLQEQFNFNSIKVRLEPTPILLIRFWHTYFNSIKVRLEHEKH